MDELARKTGVRAALIGCISSSRVRSRIAASVVTLACVAALVFFASKLGERRPLGDWLFWHYARIWAWGALFTVGCLAAGDRVMHSVLKIRDLPRLERVVFSMTVGVVVFVVAMFALGA